MRDSFLIRILQSGLVAAAASGVVASLASRRRNATAPLNAVAHIYEGGRPAARDGPGHRNTLLGAALHAGASLWWAAFYEGLFGRARRSRAALAGGACVAAAAYVVDYHVVGERFRPGFEKHLGPGGMLAVYAALGAGFALPALRRLRHHQPEDREERRERRPAERDPDRPIAVKARR